MMKKEDFEKILGKDYVITDLLEDENSTYVFYVTKEFYDSNGNDRYALIGTGPLFYNKKTGECKNLGSMEFREFHANKSLFDEKFENSKIPSFEEILSNIQKRKHVNFDDFEYFMMYQKINLDAVRIYSENFMDEIIESENRSYIELFIDFFDKTGLSYTLDGLNKIILKANNPFP